MSQTETAKPGTMIETQYHGKKYQAKVIESDPWLTRVEFISGTGRLTHQTLPTDYCLERRAP